MKTNNETLEGLNKEYLIVQNRVKALSKKYRNVYDMNNDFLLKRILSYKDELKTIAKDILRYRFKDGCNSFNFNMFSTYIKTDNTINYQM